MRLLLAIFFPFLAFFTIGRPFATGIICLILQITVLGWMPASNLGCPHALGQYFQTDKKIEEALAKGISPNPSRD